MTGRLPQSDPRESPVKSSASDSLSRTPGPPFEPPQRRSSPAFSKIPESPLQTHMGIDLMVTPELKQQTPTMCSNMGKKRATGTPFVPSGVPPGRVTQLQKVFQAARANLHLDMQFAASPGGSIDSRLPSSRQRRPERALPVDQHSSTEKHWRYSTVPQLFTTTSLDVREPFLDGSPELPTMVSGYQDIDLQPVEPASSGFVSPTDSYQIRETDESGLPPLPGPSPLIGDDNGAETPNKDWRNVASQEQDADDLAQPMTALKMDNGQMTDDSFLEDSPTVEHLRRVSGCSYHDGDDLEALPDSMFLSQTAKAAAEFAKAKRGLLKQARYTDNDDREGATSGAQCLDSTAPPVSTCCSDPRLHQAFADSSWPGPFAHDRLGIPRASSASADEEPTYRHYLDDSNTPELAGASRIPATSRTTTDGSPISSSRQTLAPYETVSTADDGISVSSGPMMTHASVGVQSRSLTQNPFNRQGEHLRQERLYSQALYNPQPHLASRLYSFSTAAAKAIGESAAPDLRIRNSYRTDTLTPLVLPLGNYGMHGTIRGWRPPGRSTEPRRPSDRRFPLRSGTRPRPQRRHRDLRFCSSPPRPTGRYVPPQLVRKRGSEGLEMSDFEIAEDNLAAAIHPTVQLGPSQEVMQIDENTRAAVRLSLYGPQTPECLQGEREGVRELSPNVDIWRRDVSRSLHYRKKRRPSYWDGDLKEVQMSPAGRGDIASSPIVSKCSMVAELDNATSKAESVTINENELVGEVEQAGIEFEQRMSNEMMEMGGSDATEMEFEH